MKKVLLLLPNGFEVLEASAFIDVMGWNRLEGDGSTHIRTCGLQNFVMSAFNQSWAVDNTIEEIKIENFDALAIPGGFEEYGYYKEAYDQGFLDLIKRFHAQEKPIASICTAALPLAESGILKNKKATTYNNPIRKEILEKRDAIITESPIVEDGNIITSSGPSTAVKVALLLLEKLTSRENAIKVAGLMGFKPR